MPSPCLSPLGPPLLLLIGVGFITLSPIYKNIFPEEDIKKPALFFPAPAIKAVENKQTWFDQLLQEISPTDIAINIAFLGIAFLYFVFEKVQSRILDGRVKKLRSCLNRSEQKLLELREQKNHLESTLKMVQNATNEYNLLLFLLLERDMYSKPNSELNQTRESEPPINDIVYPLQE